MKSKPMVLVAEDDPNDEYFLRRAFQKYEIAADLHVVGDGEKVINYLKTGNERDNGVPDLVLLDIKTPKRDGFEVLRWMRNHEACRMIPVVMLSASDFVQDMARAYEFGANAYVLKPSGFDQLGAVCKRITDLFLYQMQQASSLI